MYVYVRACARIVHDETKSSYCALCLFSSNLIKQSRQVCHLLSFSRLPGHGHIFGMQKTPTPKAYTSARKHTHNHTTHLAACVHFGVCSCNISDRRCLAWQVQFVAWRVCWLPFLFCGSSMCNCRCRILVTLTLCVYHVKKSQGSDGSNKLEAVWIKTVMQSWQW